jgi:hypothetical protein
MSDFMLQVLIMLVSWVGVVITTYFMVRWCFDYQMTWKKILIWFGWITAGVLGSVGIFYLLPQRGQDIFNTIVAHFVCAAAVHALMLRTDDYFTKKYHKSIPAAKLYMGIIALYVLMALDAVFIIQLGSHTVAEIAQICITYLTRAAILMCLILEIKLRGTPKDSTVESYMEDY